MSDTRQWQPTTSKERYENVDIIRGLALFGVLIVNLLSDFRVPLLEHIQQPYPDDGRWNHWVDLFVGGFLEFKALTIFSVLFGVGVAIQAERAAFGSVGVQLFLIRRMLCLFVLGTAHLFLIWNGDILALYAICGLLLVPAVRLPWPVLVFVGVVFIALQEVVSFDLNLPTGAAASAAISYTRQIYGDAGFFAILQFRWKEAWSLMIPLIISVSLRTTGLMYLGMGAWRSGVLREPKRNRGVLISVLSIAICVGVPTTINDISVRSTGQSLWPALRAPHVDASILLALAYVCGLLLWLTPKRAATVPGLAAIGRMALTNYVLQSVVLTFLFYGYGIGLFGRIGSAAAAALGALIYALQVVLSQRWLQRFRFGPLEWLWRSLSYAHRQPMKKSNMDAIIFIRGYLDKLRCEDETTSQQFDHHFRRLIRLKLRSRFGEEPPDDLVNAIMTAVKRRIAQGEARDARELLRLLFRTYAALEKHECHHNQKYVGRINDENAR